MTGPISKVVLSFDNPNLDIKMGPAARNVPE